MIMVYVEIKNVEANNAFKLFLILDNFRDFLSICNFSNNRFDLIFLILDPQDEHFDRRLGTHLVSLYHMSEAEAEEESVVSILY